LDECGKTQRDLSTRLNITSAFVSNILLQKCGRKSRAKYIPIIAELLGITRLPDDVEAKQ
jgi:hypothetical protein